MLKDGQILDARVVPHVKMIFLCVVWLGCVLEQVLVLVEH